MKKLFAAAFGLLSMTCAAKAEDAWNHGGMYAGVAGGYSTGQLSAPGFTVGDQGLNGGAFIGYGIVGKSGLYLGIEADEHQPLAPQASEARGGIKRVGHAPG